MTKIFISYGREDTEIAKRMYRELRAAGLDPWLATESLIPGEKFKPTIRKAIRESRYFLALLSSRSVSRKGFINRELTDALEVLKEYPESEIFLIPVRLDDCRPSSEELSELHWVDMFPSWDEGMKQIAKAIKLEVSKLNTPSKVEKHSYSPEQRKEVIKRKIASTLDVEESEVTPEATLTELGGSFYDCVQILMDLEGECGIILSEQDAEWLQIIRDILEISPDGNIPY